MGAGQDTSQEGDQRWTLVTDHTQKMDLPKSKAEIVYFHGGHENRFVYEKLKTWWVRLLKRSQCNKLCYWNTSKEGGIRGGVS